MRRDLKSVIVILIVLVMFSCGAVAAFAAGSTVSASSAAVSTSTADSATSAAGSTVSASSAAVSTSTAGSATSASSATSATSGSAVTSSSSSNSTNSQVVKVGVYGSSIYAYQDEDGVWRGMDIECLTNIAQREGLTFEFIDSVNDPDFLASLENGTYDILTDIVPTSERESRFLFSDTPVGSASSANLAVRADDGRWEYGNIEQLSKMKIGLVSEFSNNQSFRDWCSERGITPTFVEYGSIGELSVALQNGEVDGEVYGALYGDADKIRTILQLDPTGLYYVFRKDSMALKNKIDEAMSQILLEDPYYLSDLNNKYAVQRGAVIEPFSNAETEYVSTHKTVTIAVVKDDEPYYWKEADGSDAGILPDYFALIADKTGLDFRFVVYDTPDAEVAAVKNGDVDAIGLYANGIISADRDGLLITQSYASTSNVVLTRTGTSTDDIVTVAVNQRSADVVGTALEADFPNATITPYDNASDCLRALDSQAADAMVCGLPSASWLMNQKNASEYSISPIPGASSAFCLAVSSGNRILCSLLSKGIAMTKTSYDGIVTQDTLPGDDLRALVERIPAAWLALAAFVLFALVICLFIILVNYRRRQKEKAAIEAAKAETERREVEVGALEKSAEEKNQFFSNISHDMRTPLNAVIGFSELAKGPDVSPEEKDQYFMKIQKSGNLLLDLINDTLTLSKVNSGKLELAPSVVYTEDVGAAVTIPIREAAAQKGITFFFDKSAYRPRVVLVDYLNLEKIFLNLLSNAVKYTPSGGHVWVTVADDPVGGNDPDLVITVRDDGIGITEEFLPHLFEPFATEGRAGASVTGTGLGLSIVKNLVDVMGGSIDVKSKVDEGTTFTVRLHLQEVCEGDGSKAGENTGSAAGQSSKAAVDSAGVGDAAGVADTAGAASAAGAADVAGAAGAASSQASALPWGTDGSLEGKCILLCEDNEINAEVAGLILQKLGIVYDVASDGKTGVGLFTSSAEHHYDAILMDVRMPVMDGLEATRAIRALDRADAKEVPIIALTADAFEDDVRKVKEAGMNDQVSKPIDPRLLVDALASALRGR